MFLPARPWFYEKPVRWLQGPRIGISFPRMFTALQPHLRAGTARHFLVTHKYTYPGIEQRLQMSIPTGIVQPDAPGGAQPHPFPLGGPYHFRARKTATREGIHTQRTKTGQYFFSQCCMPSSSLCRYAFDSPAKAAGWRYLWRMFRGQHAIVAFSSPRLISPPGHGWSYPQKPCRPGYIKAPLYRQGHCAACR